MEPYSGDTKVIAKVGTTPEDRGLETEDFKAKFDEGLTAFVQWFNTEHKTEFEAHLADRATDVDGAHGLKYERGTFTPVLKFTSGAGVLTVSSANYIKVNSLVYFTLYINVNVTTASGGISIGGIPYPNRGGFTAITVAHQTLFEADGGAVDISSDIVFFKGADSPVLASTGIRYAMISGTYITD